MNIIVLSPAEISIDGAPAASLADVVRDHPAAVAAVQEQLTRFFFTLRAAVATEHGRVAEAVAARAAAEAECAELRAFAAGIIARAKDIHAGLSATVAEAAAGLARLTPGAGESLPPERIAAALEGAGALVARASAQLAAIGAVISRAETPAQQRRLAEVEEKLAALEREREALAAAASAPTEPA